MLGRIRSRPIAIQALYTLKRGRSTFAYGSVSLTTFGGHLVQPRPPTAAKRPLLKVIPYEDEASRYGDRAPPYLCGRFVALP